MTGSAVAQVVLELFVQGQSAQSGSALETVRRVCDARFGSAYSLEVIDIHQQPERTRAAGVIATPVLVRRHPAPVLHTVGRLTETRILKGVGLDAGL